MNLFVVLAFLIISGITLGGAIGVVTARTVFASGLFLVMAFVGVSGLYVLLEAPFLAAAQLLIYAGAVAILVLFAIMLTRRVMNEAPGGQTNNQWAVAAFTATMLFFVLISATVSQEWNVLSTEPPADVISALGEAFLGPYILPFEIISVLLLAALVGAIIIARE
jgi:NADH:ubiquinone oxidoreductase subunit 6 (subunit J)